MSYLFILMRYENNRQTLRPTNDIALVKIESANHVTQFKIKSVRNGSRFEVQRYDNGISNHFRAFNTFQVNHIQFHRFVNHVEHYMNQPVKYFYKPKED